eukprot:4043017-Amphidinium_carterae.1
MSHTVAILRYWPNGALRKIAMLLWRTFERPFCNDTLFGLLQHSTHKGRPEIVAWFAERQLEEWSLKPDK